jgi:hypothetical protein
MYNISGDTSIEKFNDKQINQCKIDNISKIVYSGYNNIKITIFNNIDFKKFIISKLNDECLNKVIHNHSNDTNIHKNIIEKLNDFTILKQLFNNNIPRNALFDLLFEQNELVQQLQKFNDISAFISNEQQKIETNAINIEQQNNEIYDIITRYFQIIYTFVLRQTDNIDEELKNINRIKIETIYSIEYICKCVSNIRDNIRTQITSHNNKFDQRILSLNNQIQSISSDLQNKINDIKIQYDQTTKKLQTDKDILIEFIENMNNSIFTFDIKVMEIIMQYQNINQETINNYINVITQFLDSNNISYEF